MNNLLSYCGLVDPRIRASEKVLPVLSPKILLNCLKNSPPEKLNGFGILKAFLQEFQRHLLHNINLSIKLLFLYFFDRKSYKSCLLSCISFQISGSIEVKEKVQLLQTSVKNGTNGNTNGNMGCQVSNEGIKFSFSEKATKFCALALMVLTLTKQISKP